MNCLFGSLSQLSAILLKGQMYEKDTDTKQRQNILTGATKNWCFTSITGKCFREKHLGPIIDSDLIRLSFDYQTELLH